MPEPTMMSLSALSGGGAQRQLELLVQATAIVAFEDAAATQGAEIIDAARRIGMQIIHVCHTASAKAVIAPRNGELRLEQSLGSALYATGLDALLQDASYSHILLLGSAENASLVATAVDGHSRGYFAHIVTERSAEDASTILLQQLEKNGIIGPLIERTQLLSALMKISPSRSSSAVERLHDLTPALLDSFHDTKLWTHARDIDTLRGQAKAVDGHGAQAGPLAGLFFSVKENIDVQGWTSTAMQVRPGIEPGPRPSTAPVVERLLRAGAILVGKNSMDLFATGICGVRCPGGHATCATDPARVPGGSSSGCAVAVAKGVVDFSIGTDTAGSVRMPAALNGIVGHKPSMSALSVRGVVACQPLLDCVGIFARNVATVRKVWLVARGHDVQDERSDPSSNGSRPAHRLARLGIDRLSRPLVIAVPPIALIDEKCEKPYQEHFRGAIQRMERCGATIRYLTMEEFQPYLRAGELVYGGLVAERYASLAPFLTRQEDWDALIPSTRQFLERAANVSSVEYTNALHERLALQAYMRSLWTSGPSGIDALMIPTSTDHATVAEATASTADDLRVNARIGLFTYAVNVLDLCAVAAPISTIPAQTSSPARPFGVTFVAPKYDDGFLLSLAEKVLEQTRDTTTAALPTKDM